MWVYPRHGMRLAHEIPPKANARGRTTAALVYVTDQLNVKLPVPDPEYESTMK